MNYLNFINEIVEHLKAELPELEQVLNLTEATVEPNTQKTPSAYVVWNGDQIATNDNTGRPGLTTHSITVFVAARINSKPKVDTTAETNVAGVVLQKVLNSLQKLMIEEFFQLKIVGIGQPEYSPGVVVIPVEFQLIKPFTYIN